MAQILIKVGDKRRIDDPAFNADWRDGHIICVRPDGYYTGIQTRKSHCVIETQHNFFGLFNANSYDDLANRSLFYDFKKYFYPATADGKYPFIENKELDYGSFLDWRMREYFIDFQWMLNQRWINKNQYESIYNKSENHQHIYLDHDLSSYIFHEDSKDRVTPNVPIVPGTIDAGGTFTVGTAQTYSDWSDAIADLPADIGAMSTPGDIIFQGNVDEVISESTKITISLDTDSYRLTLTNAIAHNGTYAGHRIDFSTTWDRFAIDEANNGTLKKFTAEKLAVLCDNTGNMLVEFVDVSSTGSDHHVRKNVINGNGIQASDTNGLYAVVSNATFGLYIYNNIFYELDVGIKFTSLYEANSIYIYNNTVIGCDDGIWADDASRSGTVEVKNNLVYGSDVEDYKDDGAGFGTHSKNVSQDATSPDAAYQSWDPDSPATPTCFSNYAADDYTLDETETTLDDGDDLSGTFTDDIEGQTRSTWFIGASEYIAVGGLSIPIAMYYQMHHNQ